MSQSPPRAAPDPSDSPSPSLTFGPYRLLERIGHGGMGEVWLAEQSQPMRRQVAIKVIKAGMDTAEVIARFAAERQALALMNHPAIARVFDTGSTPEGRPFFAMEYVKGEAITSFCDRQRLSTRDRLLLFQQVCDGVQHAHQKAIIHRDLKPSNILVALQDDRPIAKVIDFGLAKAMTQPLTERTLYTQLGQMIGTPEYMSPEQADSGNADVDTRSDVYSLGVILYELVCGTLPFDRRLLRDASLGEVQRQIREVDPPRPSTRLSQLGADTTTVAGKRRTDPGTLRRALRGDLDWITMKALAKERTRRYAAVAELRADIDRHLNDEPVLASPPSRIYAALKFVRRHRAGVAGAAVLAIACIAATAISLGQARRAQAAERRAQHSAATAEQVADFLASLFDAVNPSDPRSRDLTARAVLDNGAARIMQVLADQPDVQCRLLITIGGVYLRLAEYEAALPLVKRALALAEAQQDQAATVDALDALATIHNDQGRVEQATSLSARAVALLEPQGAAGEKQLAGVLLTRGNVLISERQYHVAEQTFRRALVLLAAQGRVDETSSLYNNIANCRFYLGDFEGALDNYRQSLAVDEAQYGATGDGSEHFMIATSLHNTALVYFMLGRYAEALPLATRALAIREKVLGPEHWHTALSLNAMAELQLAAGYLPAAERLVRRALQIDEKQFEPDKSEIAGDLDLLGRILLAQKNWQAAREAFERSMAIRQRLQNVTEIVTAHVSLGDLLRSTNDLEGAKREYRQALTLAANDASTAITRFYAHAGLTRIALARQQPVDGLLAQARQAAAAVWPAGHPDLAKLEGEVSPQSRAR